MCGKLMRLDLLERSQIDERLPATDVLVDLGAITENAKILKWVPYFIVNAFFFNQMDNINEFMDASEFIALDSTYHNQTKPKSPVLTCYGRGQGSSGRSEPSMRECKTKNTQVECLDEQWVENASDFKPKPTGKGRGRRLYENYTPTGLQFDTTNAAKVSRQIEQVVGTGHRNYTLESEYRQRVLHNESFDSVGATSSASYHSANEEIDMEKSSEFDKSFPPLQ